MELKSELQIEEDRQENANESLGIRSGGGVSLFRGPDDADEIFSSVNNGRGSDVFENVSPIPTDDDGETHHTSLLSFFLLCSFPMSIPTRT